MPPAALPRSKARLAAPPLEQPNSARASVVLSHKLNDLVQGLWSQPWGQDRWGAGEKAKRGRLRSLSFSVKISKSTSSLFLPFGNV